MGLPPGSRGSCSGWASACPPRRSPRSSVRRASARRLAEDPRGASSSGPRGSAILACDFLTVETLLLKTYYVLFFIELKTRRVHLAGVTRHPDGAWVTQQARNVTADLREAGVTSRFLIRDRDTKFTRSFDAVFQGDGLKIIATPIRAPNANAHAERWVGTVRSE